MKPKFYRSMLPSDEDPTLPKVGSDGRSLGIRLIANGAPIDELPVVNGRVQPGTGGMSVNRSRHEMPYFLIPKSHAGRYPDARGNNALRAWRYGESEFASGPVGDALQIRIDPDKVAHAFIEPAIESSVDSYCEALRLTQSEWTLEDW